MPTLPPDRTDQYFAGTPQVASAPRQIELVLSEGRLIRLRTDRGVFSADRVDAGTATLLALGPPLPTGAPVVSDVGCGYGPIAVALALRGGPDVTVWAVDVNQRARELCRGNAEANGVGDRVRVTAPEDVPADLVVDQMWSNPPIRVGKAVLHDLLRAWLGRLRPGTGSAALVVHKHLGADSLARWLVGDGWPTERVASRAGYRVLAVRAEPDGGSAGAATDLPPTTRRSRDRRGGS